MATASALKIRPLHDRIIVYAHRRGRAEGRRHHHPRQREGKAPAGQGRRGRQGQDREGRQGHAARRQGRRHHPVRQVLRPGDQARRRGVPDHARGRESSASSPRSELRPAGAGRRSTRSGISVHGTKLQARRRLRQHGKADYLRRGIASGHPARRQRPRQRGQGHPRPQGPQRRPRQEVRLPHDHQGRRHRRQGNRPQGPAREHGRPDGPRSRQQDVRHRRRRHHDRHRARPGDLPRGREERRRRRQPDGAQARHREGRRSRSSPS